MEAAHEAVRLDPAATHAHAVRAWALLANKRIDEAREAAEHVAQLAPDDADSHRLLGEVERIAKRDEPAIAHYRRALALNPEDAEILNNLGVVYARTGRDVASERAYTAAARLDPRDDTPRENLTSIASVKVWATAIVIATAIAARLLFLLIAGGRAGVIETVLWIGAIFLAAFAVAAFVNYDDLTERQRRLLRDRWRQRRWRR